jgi:hypothetical protein
MRTAWAKAMIGLRRKSISMQSGWSSISIRLTPVSEPRIAMCQRNGSTQGSVFLNPPYGPRYGHVPWLRKLIAHNNGIGLFRAYTSADWFHSVLLPAKAVLMFPSEKIKFIRPDGSIGKQPGHGNVFVGLGDVACAALLSVDPKIGVCWDRRLAPGRNGP